MQVFEVGLRHVATGENRRAELHTPARDCDRESFLLLWRPFFEERLAALQPQSVDERASYDLQDMHWQWDSKASKRSSYLRTFSISCEDQTQGLMLVSLDPLKKARTAEHRGRGLVYVELIATAPWNCPRMVGAARYRGVGRVFLSAAISLSVEEEYRGVHRFAFSAAIGGLVSGYLRDDGSRSRH